MKEALGSLNSEVLRPVVTLAVPGAIASWPYAVLLFRYVPGAWCLAQRYRLEADAVGVGIFIAVGFLLEDVGSQIEVYFDDQLEKKSQKDLHPVWNAYLGLAFKHEPIGQRYLKEIRLRMKFELSAAISLVAGAWGVYRVVRILDAPDFLWCLYGLLGSAVAVFLCYEAKTSHELLAKTRKAILSGVGKMPQ